MYYFVCFVWSSLAVSFFSKLSPPIDQICVVRTVLLPKESPGFSRRLSKDLADSTTKFSEKEDYGKRETHKTSSLLAKSMQGATPLRVSR